MNEKSAARRRALSRWIGYGGVILAAIVAGAWYILKVKVREDPVSYFQIAGKDILPKDLLPVIGAAVLFVIIAILLRVSAARAAARDEGPLSDDDGDEALTAAENEGESVYEEEPLPAVGEEEEAAALPAPADEAVAVSAAPEPASEQPAQEKKSGRVIASLEVRVPSDPAKDAKKAEKKAKRAAATAKVRAAIGRTADKAFPPEKREAVKKKAEEVKKAAKIIIPVAVTCIVVAKIAKKRRQKKREKERARNRQQFYKWLG